MSKKTNFTSIGGQALIEGVMMKGPDKVGIAVRKSDGEIVTKVNEYTPVTKKHKILSLPIIRGVVNFFCHDETRLFHHDVFCRSCRR